MGTEVSKDDMQQVFDEAKTPHKYGIVIKPAEGVMLDCPSVFRHNDTWFMIYVCMNKVDYETHLAKSTDLLKWTELGIILPFSADGQWDRWQAAGGVALVDYEWGSPTKINTFDGKYWQSYLGGALQGYETDPLSIGLAWTKTPDQAQPWHRYEHNPVLTRDQADRRPFEEATLYKSFVMHDPKGTLEHPFIMYYNGKQFYKNIERIGMAVSDDMVHWTRYGTGPVIDNNVGISGDPQIVRMGDLWVMFYFGHVWKPKAFDTFACSRDLVNWTKWDGPHLVEPSEPWDKTFAHKPWLIKQDGVVYHFYCAVGDQGRAIALATSKDMR